MYHVYRFLDNQNNVLYIGYTSNILTRMREQHFDGYSHLDNSLILKVSKVEHLAFNSKDEALYNEDYYINLYNPPFNTVKHLIEPNLFNINSDWSFYCDICNGKIIKICDLGNTSSHTRRLLILPIELKTQLEKLAKDDNRSFNNLVITVLKDYVSTL